jgi:hypothetical protein
MNDIDSANHKFWLFVTCTDENGKVNGKYMFTVL